MPKQLSYIGNLGITNQTTFVLMENKLPLGIFAQETPGKCSFSNEYY